MMTLGRLLVVMMLIVGVSWGQTPTPTRTSTPTPTATMTATGTPTISIGGKYGHEGRNIGTLIRGPAILGKGQYVIPAGSEDTTQLRPILDKDGNSTTTFINMIDNSMFQGGAGGWASGGGVTGSYDAAQSAIQTTDSGAMKLVATSPGGVTRTIAYTLERDQSFSFGCSIKVNGTAATVSIGINTSSPDEDTTSTKTFYSADGDWFLHALSVNLVDGQIIDSVQITMSDAGTVWVDNVQLVPAGHWPGFIPNVLASEDTVSVGTVNISDTLNFDTDTDQITWPNAELWGREWNYDASNYLRWSGTGAPRLKMGNAQYEDDRVYLDSDTYLQADGTLVLSATQYFTSAGAQFSADVILDIDGGDKRFTLGSGNTWNGNDGTFETNGDVELKNANPHVRMGSSGSAMMFMDYTSAIRAWRLLNFDDTPLFSADIDDASFSWTDPDGNLLMQLLDGGSVGDLSVTGSVSADSAVTDLVTGTDDADDDLVLRSANYSAGSAGTELNIDGDRTADLNGNLETTGTVYPNAIQARSGSALNINEDGGSAALTVETDGDLAATIANQKVGIGATPISSAQLYITTNQTSPRGLYLEQTGNSAAAPLCIFQKSRAGAAVQSGDYAMFFGASPHDGSSFVSTPAGYTIEVNGSVSTNSVPCDAVIRTGAAASSSGGSERLRIYSAGGKARFGADAGLFMNWDTSANTIGFGTDGSNVFSVDTDAPAAGLTYTGGMDIDKELTVGSSSAQRNFYYPASRMSGDPSTSLLVGGANHNPKNWKWSPSAVANRVNVSIPLPVASEGTAIGTFTICFELDDASGNTHDIDIALQGFSVSDMTTVDSIYSDDNNDDPDLTRIGLTNYYTYTSTAINDTLTAGYVYHLHVSADDGDNSNSEIHVVWVKFAMNEIKY